jgi:hypothetical protein
MPEIARKCTPTHPSGPHDGARFRAASTIARLTDLRRAINPDE